MTQNISIRGLETFWTGDATKDVKKALFDILEKVQFQKIHYKVENINFDSALCKIA